MSPLKEGAVGPFPDGADPEEYDRLRRRVLWTMPSGLYVVGSRDGDRRNLMTLNWATQVSSAPKLLGIGDTEAFDLGGLIGAIIGVMILLGIYRLLVSRSEGPERPVTG